MAPEAGSRYPARPETTRACQILYGPSATPDLYGVGPPPLRRMLGRRGFSGSGRDRGGWVSAYDPGRLGWPPSAYREHPGALEAGVGVTRGVPVGTRPHSAGAVARRAAAY